MPLGKFEFEENNSIPLPFIQMIAELEILLKTKSITDHKYSSSFHMITTDYQKQMYVWQTTNKKAAAIFAFLMSVNTYLSNCCTNSRQAIDIVSNAMKSLVDGVEKKDFELNAREKTFLTFVKKIVERRINGLNK